MYMCSMHVTSFYVHGGEARTEYAGPCRIQGNAMSHYTLANQYLQFKYIQYTVCMSSEYHFYFYMHAGEAKEELLFGTGGEGCLTGGNAMSHYTLANQYCTVCITQWRQWQCRLWNLSAIIPYTLFNLSFQWQYFQYHCAIQFMLRYVAGLYEASYVL